MSKCVNCGGAGEYDKAIERSLPDPLGKNGIGHSRIVGYRRVTCSRCNGSGIEPLTKTQERAVKIAWGFLGFTWLN